jgi:signal peptidase II
MSSQFWTKTSISIGTIILDQSSKYLVTTNDWPYLYNDGIAFSLPLSNTIAMIVSILLVIILIRFGNTLYQGTWKRIFNASLGLVIGGAIGNIIDRLHAPGVIDFIKLPYWPTFNLADIAVCSGIGILLVLLYLDSKQQV